MPEGPTRLPAAAAEVDPARLRRARAVRRGFVAGLALFVALGTGGFLGVRSRQVSAAAEGYQLTVRYASVSRPGLATPFTVEVTRSGGFPDGLVVAVTSSYLDGFDENGLDPAPVAEASDGARSIWTFGPSPGDTLAISFDARIEPGVQLTRLRGRVAVLEGRVGRPVVGVDLSTLVLP